MRNLERLTVETGRVIHRRYLLQRLIKRGNACAVYQGFDQVLQRAVAVKVTPAEHMSAYRAAIRATSQFTHPNIVGLYDLIIEPETLYIVQEYVDGNDFGTLLQSQLSPYYVAEMGMQLCQALLYASTPVRKTCHGDLTPASIIRDQRGQVRINNFALPSDMYYFTAWSVVGSDNIAVSDRELPPGQFTEGRRDDDTRAVGLLLYQLLSGRNVDAVSIEPPADGRLRFLRTVPPELCDVIAKAVVRQHPQHINTPDLLYAELKTIVDHLEPPAPAPQASYHGEDAARMMQFSPTPTPSLKLPAPPQFANVASESEFPTRIEANTRVSTMDVGAATTGTGMSMKLAAARQAVYAPELHTRRVNMPLIILIGLVLFILFFLIGYFIAHTWIP